MWALFTEKEMRPSLSYSGRQMCTEYKRSSLAKYSGREVCRRRSRRAPVESEVLPRMPASGGCPSPLPRHCFFFFLLARRKTSVSYLNGTLYWRSPELVSSLFNFRKWCHNALNNSAGWFIFPWTCCPKHSSSLAVFPINCKLECSSYFIMILRGGGRRLGWKQRSRFRGCRGSALMTLLSCPYWDWRVLSARGMVTSGKLEHCWLVSKNFWKRKPEGSGASCSESL